MASYGRPSLPFASPYRSKFSLRIVKSLVLFAYKKYNYQVRNDLLLSNLLNDGRRNVILIVNFQRLQKFHVSQHLLRRSPIVLYHASRSRGIGLSLGFNPFHDTNGFHDKFNGWRWVLWMRKSNIADSKNIWIARQLSIHCDSQSSQSIQSQSRQSNQARALQMVFPRASERPSKQQTHSLSQRQKSINFRGIPVRPRSRIIGAFSSPELYDNMKKRRALGSRQIRGLWKIVSLVMEHCDMPLMNLTQNDWNSSLSEHRVKFHCFISSSCWPTRFLSNNAKEVTKYVRVQGLRFTW